MARGKQNQGQQKDGKHRKETKEERKIRLAEQARAREACQKWIPYVVGAVVFFLIAFGAYVRSVPPKVIPVPVPAEPLMMTPIDAIPPDAAGSDMLNDANAQPESEETVEL